MGDVLVPLANNPESVAVALLSGSYRWNGQTYFTNKPVYNHNSANLDYWLYPRNCESSACEWWVCVNVQSDAEPCYSSSQGGFLYNLVKVACPHHYNTSDEEEQWREIPETDPVNDGTTFVQLASTDNRNADVTFGSHLQYLQDAIDRLHLEEDDFIEQFILDIPLNPFALIFIGLWHFVFGCLYICLIVSTRQKKLMNQLEIVE